MKKKASSYVIPYDLSLQPNPVVGRNERNANTTANDIEEDLSNSIVLKGKNGPAEIGAAEHNAALLREALVDLMAQGLVKSGAVEIPPGASTSAKMTLKEFKAAYANKPGATFRCPEHLKNQLDDD